MTTTRRLAAILAADVVGYSRLIGARVVLSKGSRRYGPSCSTRRLPNITAGW
jgi:hypothetical protein